MAGFFAILVYGALMAAVGFYAGYDLGHTETDDWEG